MALATFNSHDQCGEILIENPPMNLFSEERPCFCDSSRPRSDPCAHVNQANPQSLALSRCRCCRRGYARRWRASDPQ
jgi:hypothetical protein